MEVSVTESTFTLETWRLYLLSFVAAVSVADLWVCVCMCVCVGGWVWAHGITEVAISTKLEIHGTSHHMASLGLLILQNWKFNRTGTSHGISGVAVFVDQPITKNCLIHAQFYSFKDSTKRINNLKAFSSVKLEAQNFRMAAFVHSFQECIRTGSLSKGV